MITSATHIDLASLHHGRPVSIDVCTDATGCCVYFKGDGSEEAQANLDLDAMIKLRRALDAIITPELARRVLDSAGEVT